MKVCQVTCIGQNPNEKMEFLGVMNEEASRAIDIRFKWNVINSRELCVKKIEIEEKLKGRARIHEQSSR
jgi:hypothetical protein